MNFSISEENYIKAIYHLQTQGGLVNTNALAKELDTKAASVTDMLKKLKAKKILQYEKYHGFKLNENGNKVALIIIRKHRLWEYFLVSKLGFEWDKVHAIAEELEHVSSAELIKRLDSYLGTPKIDPHGDPIPDSNGKISVQQQLPLSDLPVSKQAIITSVQNQSSELLSFLSSRNIIIGTKLEIKRRLPFDNSLEIKFKNKQSINISEQVANAIRVNPL